MKIYVQSVCLFCICIFIMGAMAIAKAEVNAPLVSSVENSLKEEVPTPAQESTEVSKSMEDTPIKSDGMGGEDTPLKEQPTPDEIVTTDKPIEGNSQLSSESIDLQPTAPQATQPQVVETHTPKHEVFEQEVNVEQAQSVKDSTLKNGEVSINAESAVEEKEQPPAIVFSTPALEQGQKLVKIVYISRLADIQKRSTQGSLASLATLLEQIRKDFPDTIFIHGGSALGPSAFSYFDQGAHMVGLLNFLEPTVISLGRRDFVHKEDELTLRAKEAAFPFLGANVHDPLTSEKNLEGVHKTIITEVDGYKIGITGLISPELGTTFVPDRLQLTGGYEILPNLVQTMQKEGADFIITLADFVPINPRQILSEFGVDMLLISDFKDSSFQFINKKPFGVFKEETEVVIFNVIFTPQSDTKPLVQVLEAPQVIALESIQAHPAMEAEIETFSASLEKLLSFPIGTTTTDLDTRTDLVRSKENAFANLVADALREYYRADIALINAGAIRGNQQYPAGSVLTRRDVYTELPLHDTATLIEIDGVTLLSVLEHAVSQVEHKKGQFLHTSGMQFRYNPKAKVGGRVQEVTIGKEALQPQKRYSVSIANYLASGGDGFAMLTEQKRPQTVHPTQDIAELFRNFLSAKNSVAASVEGRIVTSGEK